jgi:hypothetical protein
MVVPEGDLLIEGGVQLCINPAWADVIGALVERLAWEDAWQGTPSEVERATQAADELFAALYGETRCVSKPWRAGGGNDMPDCVEFASSDGIHIDTINICEDKCDVPIYVNIYDCCCGDGGKLPGGNGNGDNGNGDIGVGFPELPSPDSPNPTVCDAAFLTAPYVISQGREFLQQADQFVDAGNAGIDFISDVAAGLEIPGAIINAMQEFIENLGELSFEDFDNALSDEDFVLKAQIAWTRTYGENRLQPDVTRQGLRTWANKLPVFWGNVLDGAVFSPRVFFFLFSYFVDMQKVRARQVLAAGASNASFCNYVYGEAQIPLPELPPPSDKPALVLNDLYWLSEPLPFQEVVTLTSNNQHYFSFDVSDYPGIAGVYFEGEVFIEAGNLLWRVEPRDPSNTPESMFTSTKNIASATNPAEYRKYFLGSSAVNDFPQLQGYTDQTTGYATDFDTLTAPRLWFSFSGNFSTGRTCSVNGTLRILVDSTVQPPPDAIA